MEDEVLLAQLRALLERAPDFECYSASSREHGTWLAQAHALVTRWDSREAASLRVAADSSPLEVFRASNVAQIFGALNRAVVDLELKVPRNGQAAFASGEVYDFFRELNGVIGSAEHSILIVDPYLDASVFDHYLQSRKNNVTCRLLLNKNARAVKAAADKYTHQHGSVIEVRCSTKIHDRVILVDGYVCWVVGQSLKDAAKAKSTYLVPLSPDVVPAKLDGYEDIWRNADEI